jgi:ribosomal protein S12 methylthiotransferase accessory factor
MSALALCSSFGDVLRPPKLVTLPQLTDAPVVVYNCDAGNISSLIPGIRDWLGRPIYQGIVVGAGAELNETEAKFKAACEGAERYSSSILLEGEYRIACYEELGSEALDWRTLPRLSDEEASAPQQLFTRFSPTDPMRWIPSLHASSGQTKWVPAVMSHVFPRPWSTERFTVPISTGTAVHSDEVLALISAVSEAIERDAIALTWLLRRPLKRITYASQNLHNRSPPLLSLLESPEFRLYDATTDLGLPTVYARRHRSGHSNVTNVVACATAFDYGTAIGKAMTEVVMVSRTLDQGSFAARSHLLDCEAIHDGAVFMARSEYAQAFDFLDGNGEVALADLASAEPLSASGSSAERARWLLDRLAELKMDLYLVNLTCDELVDVGLHCLRAIVPQLMPLSLVQRARFLATARLQSFSELEGLSCRGPVDINPFPQPFA